MIQQFCTITVWKCLSVFPLLESDLSLETVLAIMSDCSNYWEKRLSFHGPNIIWIRLLIWIHSGVNKPITGFFLSRYFGTCHIIV